MLSLVNQGLFPIHETVERSEVSAATFEEHRVVKGFASGMRSLPGFPEGDRIALFSLTV